MTLSCKDIKINLRWTVSFFYIYILILIFKLWKIDIKKSVEMISEYCGPSTLTSAPHQYQAAPHL